LSSTKIGLGLAAIGRPEYINVRQVVDVDKSEQYYRDNAFKMLDFAYSRGIRHFDTAPSYGKGEEFLQQWYKENPYDDLIFSTKWGYTYVANWNLGYNGAHEIKEHSIHKLLEQWSVSKHLLPALKVYQIHSATFESAVLENAEVLQKLYEIKRKTGLKMGVSVSGEHQSEIIACASQIKIKEEPLFESFQVTYNILETSSHDILRSLIKAGKLVIIKEALANGRIFRNDGYKHYSDLYTELNNLSEKYRVSVDAIALRFIMDHLQPGVILSGASNTRQLSENMKALKFTLENQELISLKQHKLNPDAYWNERKHLQWN
jgi:aryl-alcohol dehydrogenase-like predicted oxidoreductase